MSIPVEDFSIRVKYVRLLQIGMLHDGSPDGFSLLKRVSRLFLIYRATLGRSGYWEVIGGVGEFLHIGTRQAGDAIMSCLGGGAAAATPISTFRDLGGASNVHQIDILCRYGYRV